VVSGDVYDLIIHSPHHVDDAPFQALLWSYSDCHSDGEVVGAILRDHNGSKHLLAEPALG
jgi:hypothetical protein